MIDAPGPTDVVSRAKTGDREAFRLLFVQHRETVSRLLFRLGIGSAELEDLVQEVFIHVYRSLGDFRGDSKFSTWLHRVAVNVVLMHRRAKKSRPTLVSDEARERVANDVSPDDSVARTRRLRAFSRLLDGLTEKKRLVFVLHDLEGLPPSEIAEIVGAPVLTVRTRLFYARKELEDGIASEPDLADVREVLAENAR